MKLVSVIVPARNAAKYLTTAIDSVRSQDIQNWELIVVDDGSTDETATIVEEFIVRDSRITLVRQQPKGLSAARNAGLRQSSGQFVQFLDADDTIAANKLSVQLRLFQQNPEVGVVHGRHRYVSIDCRSPTPKSYPSPIFGYLLEFLLHNLLVVNAPLTRARVFERIGLFAEKSSCYLPIYGCEDWDLWLRAARAGIHFLSHHDVVVENRWHREGMSQAALLMKRSALWVLEEAALCVDEFPRRLRSFLALQLAYRRVEYLSELLALNRLNEASEAANLMKTDRGAGLLTLKPGQFVNASPSQRLIVRNGLRVVARLASVPAHAQILMSCT